MTRPKAPSDDGACDIQEISTEVMAEQSTSTVNIGQLGNQAEVQLAEALVAVSEGLVMTPQVVAVEETSSQANEVRKIRRREGWVRHVKYGGEALNGRNEWRKKELRESKNKEK